MMRDEVREAFVGKREAYKERRGTGKGGGEKW